MNRRKAIQLSGISIALLSGCATRSAPAPTNASISPVTLAPLTSSTVLPVANADFHILDNRDIETSAAITNDSADKKLDDVYVDRAAIDLFHLKMSALQMTVYKKFDQELFARLRQDGIAMTRYDEPDEAIAVRVNGDLATLGPGTDAVVDVRVASLGYRPILSAMAMTPEAKVTLKIVRVVDSATLADAQYTFDWRASEGDTRHFRCEQGDLFSSVDAMMANLPKVAAILDRGTMLMVNRVADDIVQIYRGEALA